MVCRGLRPSVGASTVRPVLAVTFLASTPIFSSPRFALVEEEFATPDGPVRRPVIHHPGAVAILAQPTPGTVLLVRQYRYPVRRWTLEIPAGTRVPGEAPETTAARELVEEAGFRPGRLCELMRFFPAVGVSDEELILYRADDLVAEPCAPEHGELVAPEIARLADAAALVASGEICDAKTLMALALLGVAMVPSVGAVR